MSEKLKGAPWIWPAATCAFAVWTLLAIYAGESRGYGKAMSEVAERDAFVSERTADVGFCAWLNITNFASECADRARTSGANQHGN